MYKIEGKGYNLKSTQSGAVPERGFLNRSRNIAKVSTNTPTPSQSGAVPVRNISSVPTPYSKAGGYKPSGFNRGIADYANLAIGVGSAIGNLTRKRPKLSAPKRFESYIRPATGDEDLLNRRLSTNASNTRAASRSITNTAGSDVASAIKGRLSVNAQRRAADEAALSDNAAVLRQEKARVAEQINRDRAYNASEERRYEENQYAEKLGEFQRKRDLGEARIQNTINYEQQRDADLRNKAIDEEMVNNRLGILDEMQVQQMATQLIAQRGYSTEQALEEARKMAAGKLLKYRTFNYNQR